MAKAYQVRQVLKAIERLEANGEAVPEPIAVKRYSGRFMVRIPPELHRRLALEAAESGISLNRLAKASNASPLLLASCLSSVKGVARSQALLVMTWMARVETISTSHASATPRALAR